MKELLLIIIIIGLSCGVWGQVFWAAGYTEALDTITNGQVLLHPMEDTVIVEPFDNPRPV